jgi:hypothetical protein
MPVCSPPPGVNPQDPSWHSRAGTRWISAKPCNPSNLSDEEHSNYRRPVAGWEKISPELSPSAVNLDLLHQFPRGVRIRCLILLRENPNDLGVLGSQIEVVRGDIRNPADCATFCEGAKDAVLFHTAGLTHPAACEGFLRNERRRYRKLLSAAIVAGVRRVVVVSSNSPIDLNLHPKHLFDESSPYCPYMN